MQDDRFDQLAKRMAARSDRRRILKGTAGGILGALAAALGVGRVQADSPQRKCKQASRPCSFDTHCCSGTCCNHRCCGPDEICNGNGQCICAPEPASTTCGTQECGTAVNNCGQVVNCGACTGTGETCIGGQCVCTPEPVGTTCGSQECDTAVNNCGQEVDCGSCAGPFETCDNGQCVPTVPTCSAGAGCGDPDVCPGACVCAHSVSGQHICVELADGNCDPPCTSDADCSGGICATAACCGAPACVPAANLCTA